MDVRVLPSGHNLITEFSGPMCRVDGKTFICAFMGRRSLFCFGVTFFVVTCGSHMVGKTGSPTRNKGGSVLLMVLECLR